MDDRLMMAEQGRGLLSDQESNPVAVVRVPKLVGETK
jgi:hypothetical protein